MTRMFLIMLNNHLHHHPYQPPSAFTLWGLMLLHICTFIYIHIRLLIRGIWLQDVCMYVCIYTQVCIYYLYVFLVCCSCLCGKRTAVKNSDPTMCPTQNERGVWRLAQIIYKRFLWFIY